MPKATAGYVAVDVCEKTLAELESEADAVFDNLVSAAEAGKNFASVMEKVDSQLSAARKLQAIERDLELNEAAVIADNLEGEIANAEKMATGSSLLEREEEWGAQLEGVHGSIELLRSHMKKIKGHGRSSMHDGSALEARGALSSFRREAEKCSASLAGLRSALGKRGPAHARVESARKRLRAVRAGVGRAFSKISKARLRKKIGEAKAQVLEFFSGTHSAKIFVDPKHLTLQSGAHKVHLPLTQSLRYALEEIAPIERQLAMLGKRGTLLTGTYEKNGIGGTLRIGERFIAGDTVVYREKSYRVSLGS